MPNGGELAIKGDIIEKTVRVSFKDTGVGIAAKHLSIVFEPLFTTKARGIGLGLTVSKNLAEINGGRITVQSEPGKGSTFTIALPTEEPSL